MEAPYVIIFDDIATYIYIYKNINHVYFYKMNHDLSSVNTAYILYALYVPLHMC